MIPRLLGVVLFVLGVLIVQIIRHRLDVLYPTTLAVRLFICTGLVALWRYARDPFFLVLLAIVGFGVLLTGATWLTERSEARPVS